MEESCNKMHYLLKSNLNIVNNNKKKPKISVIIPSYNQGRLIETSIQSVIIQEYPNLELIIIDGNSNDNTKIILQKYDSVIDYWVSEKDTGVYEAMNKGIDKATGDWIYFLGTDDKILPNVLNEVGNYLDDKYVTVFGSMIFDNGHIHKSYLNWRTVLQNTLHHQSAFYNRKLFEDFRYDTSLKAISDYELNLKIYLKKCNYLKLTTIIAECMKGGISGAIKNAIHETHIIRKKHINSLHNYIYSVTLGLYFLIKQIK